MRTPIFTPRGYPGEQPDWRIVPATNLIKFPYRNIARIWKLDAAGNRRGVGTAWRWREGLAITAAHVVDGAAAVDCVFTDGVKTEWQGVTDIHPDYFTATLAPRIGSPEDIAVISLSDRSGGGLEIGDIALPGEVSVIGFPSKVDPMVEHKGEAWSGGEYVAHAAHTHKGHSGAPILQNGKVVGLHVADITAIAKWRPGLSIKTPSGSNAGIKFDSTQIEFINERLASRGFIGT